ncbi:VOC family protein [Roseitranquillus sediminis]|uniref:VOC family protein n=1 Tax=Roseitranquillus sediminis TaxID=2809051 RepID=UPI001D0C2D55|nr:VOC family protein [Roseitranquillus sediminis]MBM9595974.1 VOC family protein [Roseitranquillus sediminis]
MTHPVKGIDHVFLLVHDLDAAHDAYARMGFNVSPRGLHSAHKGSANHTMMFADDYIELLGLVAETEGNAARRATLDRDGEGLHAVACRIDDADAAKAALDALGIATGTVGAFSRPVPLPGGGEGEASFRTLEFRESEVPLGTCFMCQHLTRDTVWIPELMAHPNGAVALTGIVAVTDDPAAKGEAFARLFAAGKAREGEAGVEVVTGERSATLSVMTSGDIAARFPDFDMSVTPARAFAAMQVAVEDLARTRSLLEAAGFSVSDTARGVAVGPAEAAGCAVEFVSRQAGGRTAKAPASTASAAAS